MTPHVSILTPVRIRNEQELGWLKECIASAQAQTFTDWEHIIVDDHTPPQYNLVSALSPILKRDKRIRLYRLSAGSGVSAARNAAVSLAQSDTILPLDADDKLSPNTLSAYMSNWKGTGFLYPSVTVFGGDLGDLTVAPEPYDFDRLMRITYLLVGNLHAKASWERAGGWRTDMAGAFEDWEYWIHLGELGVCGEPCPDAMYYYRRNPSGRIAATIASPFIAQDAIEQIKRTHSMLYKGVKPMSCCGGRNSGGAPVAAPQGVMGMMGDARFLNVPGAAAGLVRLHYLQGNVGLVPWYGPVTGQQYAFSSEHPVSYVDARDAEKMVLLVEGRQPVFEIIANDAPSSNATVAKAEQVELVGEPVAGENAELTPEWEARNHPIELSSDDEDETSVAFGADPDPEDIVAPKPAARPKRKPKNAKSR